MNKQSIKATPSIASRLNAIAAPLLATLLLSGCASPHQTPGTLETHSVKRNANAPIQHLKREQIEALFIESKYLVSAETGADLNHIKLKFSNDRNINLVALNETERLVNSQFTNASFASHFLDAITANQEKTYVALFSPERSEVMLNNELLHEYMDGLASNAEVQRAAVQALLIHELVHASDDVLYGIHKNRTLNFRASFAQSATFEGHAQYLTRYLCLANNCSIGLDALDQFMFSDKNPPNKLAQPIQAVSRDILEYSYVEGENFMQQLAQRPDGDHLIKRLLANPPVDPIQILDPASYPNVQREYRNQTLLGAITRTNHQWNTQPWTVVQTSPLKGVNLRAAPQNRPAAIKGFTKLIISMVSAQLYNQDAPNQLPVEITLLQTDHNGTATLFAQRLHENAINTDSVIDGFLASTQAVETFPKANVRISSEKINRNTTFHSVVSQLGKHVIQVAGIGEDANVFVEYALNVLATLNNQQQPISDDALQASLSRVSSTVS